MQNGILRIPNFEYLAWNKENNGLNHDILYKIIGNGDLIYTYDSNNNVFTNLLEIWDYSLNILRNDSYSEYQYNSVNKVIIQDYSSNWKQVQGEYTNRLRDQFICSSAKASIENLTDAKRTKLFPNPANNRLNIDLAYEAEIEIYSLTGILMDKFSAKQNHIVDISAYPNEMYFVKTKNETIKFVKQ